MYSYGVNGHGWRGNGLKYENKELLPKYSWYPECQDSWSQLSFENHNLESHKPSFMILMCKLLKCLKVRQFLKLIAVMGFHSQGSQSSARSEISLFQSLDLRLETDCWAALLLQLYN